MTRQSSIGLLGERCQQTRDGIQSKRVKQKRGREKCASKIRDKHHPPLLQSMVSVGVDITMSSRNSSQHLRKRPAEEPLPQKSALRQSHGTNTKRARRTSLNGRRRSVTFAVQVATIHVVPSVFQWIEHESELWLQADAILRTIDEAVQVAEQDRPAQERYLQNLTETYCHCCSEDDKLAAAASSAATALLASYRGLEFAVLPELSGLRRCQRTKGIQNVVALSKQLRPQQHTDNLTLASVAERSSRTARRFAQAMGAADRAAALLQDDSNNEHYCSSLTPKAGAAAPSSPQTVLEVTAIAALEARR